LLSLPLEARGEFVYLQCVNANQFKRWLARQGCTFETRKGGHVIVRRDGRMSVLPIHGGKKQLGTGLMNRIKKNLGLG